MSDAFRLCVEFSNCDPARMARVSDWVRLLGGVVDESLTHFAFENCTRGLAAMEILKDHFGARLIAGRTAGGSEDSAAEVRLKIGPGVAAMSQKANMPTPERRGVTDFSRSPNRLNARAD